MTKLKTHLIALAGVALVAFAGVESPHYGTATFLVALIAVATVGAVFMQIRGRRQPITASSQPVRQSSNGLVTTKRVLIAFMALGIAAYIGGSGTFATFNAETANPGSQVSSGTLTLTDQVNSNVTVCASLNANTQDNYNGACDMALNITNLAPGGYDGVTGAAKLTLANTGSLDASKFFLYGSYVNGVLTAGGALTSGVAITTLGIASLEGPVTSGDTITLSYGTHTQSCTAGGNVAATSSATSIPVSCVPANANFSYPQYTRVLDTSSDTSPTNTDCWDAKTTTSPVVGASKGTDLNFNPTTGNPLCTTALFWVQEQTGGKNYCWAGKGSSPENSLGMCNAPISALLTATSNGGTSPYSVTAGTTSLSFGSGLKGNIKSGDTLVVTDKTVSATATCTAGSNQWIGDTSVTVGSCTSLVNNTLFTTGNTYVTDTTTLTTLNSDTTDTISNFDTAHDFGGEIQLYPLTSNGNSNTSAAIELNRHAVSGDTRIFWVGVYLPAPTSGGQNQLQGLMSTFGFNWHIDQ
jgi:hypothetical protein